MKYKKTTSLEGKELNFGWFVKYLFIKKIFSTGMLLIYLLHLLAHLKEKLKKDNIHLVMAGGYDDRVTENKEYYLELKKLADDLNVSENINFVRSFSDEEKRTLLRNSLCLLYTPDREHFGIVPIEAMYNRCPVIAVNSGGPMETVEDGVTGYLCSQSAKHFAEAMMKMIIYKDLSKTMGEAGRERVIDRFSFTTFTNQLNTIVLGLVEKERSSSFTLWIAVFITIISILFYLSL